MTNDQLENAKLHAWQIEAEQYLRHEKRRGRRHAYPTLQATSTALIVIDMLPFFVSENPYCRGIVPKIARLSSSLRTAGGTVVWVLPKANLAPARRAFFGEAVADLYSRAAGSGAPETRLWPEFEVQPADLLVEKSAYSAFFPGSSPLHAMLQTKNIDTVLITGTVTNVCCESSARDASELGYRVIMVADANAGVSDQSHNATLHTIYRSFGDVRPTDEVLELIASGS